MNDTSSKPRVAYLTVGYPTLSQTFIQREVENLSRNDIDITVFPCRQFGFPHEVNGVNVIPVHPAFPLLVLGSLLRLIFLKPLFLIRTIRSLGKYQWNSLENIFASLWGVISGLVISSEARHLGIQEVHGAWATLPATAAAVVSYMNDIPFSFGAHAYDIYRHGGDGFLKRKLDAASFIHTTTQTNVEYLKGISPQANVVLARRGLTSLPNTLAEVFTREKIQILSVGRLIKKKGYFHQLAALRELLDREIDAQLRIIGEGPLREKLEENIRELKLAEHVILMGALEPIEVARIYRDSDVFWFTGIIDDEGDRDGLPNVIPEAMSHGVPVISSKSSGAMEAVENEATGLVVDTASAKELADATLRLANDKEATRRFTLKAREWVEENFIAVHNTAIIGAAMKKSILGDK